jgi:elongation factor 1-alpha
MSLSVVGVGVNSPGITTLLGHLLVKTGGVTSREQLAAEKRAIELGRESCKFSFLINKRKEEIERGRSKIVTIKTFLVERYTINLVDSTCWSLKHLVFACGLADVAILVVSAEDSFEANVAMIQDRACVILGMGIKHLILAVNKFDLPEINWSKARYDFISGKLSKALKKMGFQSLISLPVSGFTGDNLSSKSSNFPWWEGPTLLEAITRITIVRPNFENEPFMFAVHHKHSPRRYVVGRVLSGRCRVGSRIFSSSNPTTTITEIQSLFRNLAEARAGDMVGIEFSRFSDIPEKTIVSDAPLNSVCTITCRIRVVYHPSKIRVGYQPLMCCSVSRAPSTWSRILRTVDPRENTIIRENPSELSIGDVAEVEIILDRPIVCCAHTDSPILSKVVFIDINRLIGFGVITSVTASPVEKGSCTKAAR